MTLENLIVESQMDDQAIPLADTAEIPVLMRTDDAGGAIHRIEVGRQSGGAGRFDCSYRGEPAFRSHQPIYDGARWLLDRGYARSGDRVETWRGVTLCMTAEVGRAVAFTVRESDRGCGVAKYVPFDRDVVMQAEAA